MGNPILIPNVHKLLMKNSQETSRVCRAKRRHEEEGCTFWCWQKSSVPEAIQKRYESDTENRPKQPGRGEGVRFVCTNGISLY